MPTREIAFSELLSAVVDNRGRTCPTEDSGIKLIATNCISNESLYPRYERLRYVSQETYENWFRGHPEPGDLIFVCKGTPGRVAMTPNRVDFCIAQDMVAVRADRSKVHPLYLFAALRSQQVQDRIRNLHVGTMIPHFKKGDFGKLYIPVPDPETQAGIGTLYFEMSRKIEINERIAASVDKLASALYRSLKRKGAGFEEVTLGDVASVNSGSVKPLENGCLRYIDISSVGVGSYEWPDEIGWSEAPGRARRKAAPGSTIWSTVRPNRRSHALLLDDDPHLVFSTGLAILTPKSVGPALLYEATRTPEFQAYLESVAEGSTYPAVRAERFKEAPILLPKSEEREEFESTVMPMRRRSHQAVRESRALANLRDTLLPQLMSGRLHVRDAEKIVEDAT
ncbi:restriction endonuclease subunit S [Streptomyces sp. NPDC001222]|uniref:restriction endonuclease subunit S n=1 Tax=Streptomyces sp. NPDC001222 TaxID=3364548 RepID=UPI0036CE5255